VHDLDRPDENPGAVVGPGREDALAATDASPAQPSLVQRLMHAAQRVLRPARRDLPVATALRSTAPAPRQARARRPTPVPDVRELGQRRLVAQLWSGALSTIWRAHDPGEDVDVAVKILHRHLAANPELRSRFFRSARVMTELAHPNVVRIREAEASDQGCFYYVMDLYRHGTLHDAVLRQRLLRSQIEPLVLSVARALAVAHQRGIVHREVKPSHILFTSADAPCLIDFDLASAELAPESVEGSAASPYPHVAPELRGRSRQADARADVYGLGMTMAFMLHGAPLPHDVAREPERFVRRLPCEPPLRRVLERAVAWDPERRFAHAGAFCSALEETMGRFRDSTRFKLVQPGAAPHLRGVRSLLEHLRTIEDQSWMHSPVLARFDMDPDDAVEHARARLHDMSEWALAESIDQPERSALRRLEYLVREWVFDRVFPLVHALPGADPGQAITIGRGRSCDVSIRSDTISKLHATVVFDPDAGGYRLTHQGSRHGTRIGGEKLAAGTSALLASGNLVILGDAVFLFFEPRLLRRLARAL
jgi:serine/threonine protein kinase